MSRSITGLILRPNQTFQGLYAVPVWDAESPSRRAMQAAVLAAQWDAAALRPRQRAVVAQDHGRRGREVMSLAWTRAHHAWGPKIDGVTKRYDSGERRMARLQTVVTAVVATRALVDGIAVRVHAPNGCEAAAAYVRATGQERSEQRGQARERRLALLHHLRHRREDTKRTESVVEIVEQLERDGHFPEAHSACDTGVLTVAWPRWLEKKGQHWVSEGACSRTILWRGQGGGLLRSLRHCGLPRPRAFGRCRATAAAGRRRRCGPLRRPDVDVVMGASASSSSMSGRI